MVTSQTAPNALTSEERIKALEDKIELINYDINRIKEDHKQDLIKLGLDFNALETRTNSKTNETVNKINTNIKTALTGDIQSPILGVFLAMIGTILSVL